MTGGTPDKRDTATPGKKGIYFGWWIVAACFVLQFFQYAPFMNLFGLYVPSLAGEFQAARTAVVAIMSVATVAGMIGSVFAGKTLVKYGFRRVWTIVILMCAASYVMSAMATSLTVMYVSSFLRGLFSAAASMVPTAILINNWFGKKIRGRATAIALMGSGVGAAVLNPVTGYIIKNFGWQTGFYCFAGFLLLLLPVCLPVFVLTPEMKGLKRIGDEPGDAGKETALHGMTSQEALRSGIFWLAFAGMTVLAGTTQSWSNNGASYLSDLQFDPVVAASIMAVCSVGLTLGKLVYGVIADKWGNKAGLTTGGAALIAGYLFLVLSARTPGLAVVGSGITGAGIAVVNVMLPLLVAEIFGNRDYAAIVSYMRISASLGATVIPPMVSMVFDVTGSFIPAWFGLCGTAAVSVIFFFITYAMKNKKAAAAR